MKKSVLSRKFLGELFPTREKRAFENAHLRAYIKGKSWFTFGFKTNEKTGQRERMFFEVKQEYFYI